jgi:hypothetical protein
MSEAQLMQSIKKVQDKRFKELLKRIPKGQKVLVSLFYMGPPRDGEAKSPYKG